MPRWLMVQRENYLRSAFRQLVAIEKWLYERNDVLTHHIIETRMKELERQQRPQRIIAKEFAHKSESELRDTLGASFEPPMVEYLVGCAKEYRADHA